MLNLIQIAMRLRDREEGQTFVEYGLILGGVSILILAAFTPMINSFGTLVTNIVNALT